MPADAGAQITELYANLEQTDPDVQVRFVAKLLHRDIVQYEAGERSP
jgi:hypothetical protein